MEIQDKLNSIKASLKKAYDKVVEKGGTLPSSQGAAGLETAIESIPSVDLSVFTFENGNHPSSVGELMMNMNVLYRWEDNDIEYGNTHGGKSFAYYTAARFGIKYIKLSKLKTFSRYAFWNNNTIEELYLPSLSGNRGTLYNNSLINSTALRVLDIGSLYCNSGNADYLVLGSDLVNLIDIRQKKTTTDNEYLFRRVKMTNAISTSLTTLLTEQDIEDGFTSNNQKWNHNLREHIIAYLPQTTDKYYYFYQSVIDAMEQETLDAFAAKGWGVAAVN